MKISNHGNIEVAETLYAQIKQIIVVTEKANPEVTQKDIIFALLESVGDVLLDITCPDCRRLNKKLIERMLPMILRDAMKEAAKYPQLSEHTH